MSLVKWRETIQVFLVILLSELQLYVCKEHVVEQAATPGNTTHHIYHLSPKPSRHKQEN